MKKTIKLSFLVLSCFCLAFIACQKQAMAEAPLQESETSKHEVANSTPYFSKTCGCNGNANNCSDGWCRDPANNCTILPEIVITTGRMQVLSSAINAGSSVEVGVAFSSTDFDYITTALPTDMASALKSGGHYLAISAEDDDQICYRAGETYPVTYENFDFAVQLAK